MTQNMSATMAQSQSNCGCGTPSRCACCNMRFVCAKSPYCCVCKSGGGGGNCPDVDLAPVLAAISEGFAYVNNHITSFESTTSDNFSYVNTRINDLANDFSYMNNHLDSVSAILQDLINNGFAAVNTKLDQIIALLPTVMVNGIVSENGLVPVSYNILPDDGTVLVEKKNIFGKGTGKYKEVKADEV